MGQTTGRQTRTRQEPNIYKGMTPPLTQNLKILGLWVFFLIYCSTSPFLLNVGLRLTFGYLIIFPLTPGRLTPGRSNKNKTKA